MRKRKSTMLKYFQQQNITILLRIHVACCEIQITQNQVNCLFSNNYRQENVRGVTAHLNTSTSEDLERGSNTADMEWDVSDKCSYPMIKELYHQHIHQTRQIAVISFLFLDHFHHFLTTRRRVAFLLSVTPYLLYSQTKAG